LTPVKEECKRDRKKLTPMADEAVERGALLASVLGSPVSGRRSFLCASHGASTPRRAPTGDDIGRPVDTCVAVSLFLVSHACVSADLARDVTALIAEPE